MFNSIRKDKKRRELFRKFEIQRLQNKVLSEAISLMENPLSFSKKKVEEKNENTLSKDNSKNSLKLLNFWNSLNSKNSKNSSNSKSVNTLKAFNSSRLQSIWQRKALKAIPRNSSKNRVQNRCIETGRSRAVLRFCKVSRICLRDKASKGLVSGVNKASW